MSRPSEAGHPGAPVPRVLLVLDTVGNIFAAACLTLMALVPGLFDPRFEPLLWAYVVVLLCFAAMTATTRTVHPAREILAQVLGILLMTGMGVFAREPVMLVGSALGNVLIALSLAMTRGRATVYAFSGLASAGTATMVLTADGQPVWRLVIAVAAVAMSWAPPLTVLGFRAEAEAAVEQARRLAVTDPLTGLVNRRGLTESAPGLVARVPRDGAWLGLLVADLDHFKSVNDVHGHAVGDEVLQRVARVLGTVVRAGDVVARTGGEELVVLAVLERRADVEWMAERIRGAVEAEFTELGVTVSIGGLALAPSELECPSSESVWHLIDRADVLMYEAKQAGRNAVRVLAA